MARGGMTTKVPHGGPSFHLAAVLPYRIRIEGGPVPCGDSSSKTLHTIDQCSEYLCHTGKVHHVQWGDYQSEWFDHVSPLWCVLGSLQYRWGSHPADILHSGNLCSAGLPSQQPLCPSRILQWFLPAMYRRSLLSGGAVKVVFMVRGSGHHEKSVRKTCVVREFGEHLWYERLQIAATRPLISALVSHRMNWYPGFSADSSRGNTA